MHKVCIVTPSSRDPKWDYVMSLMGLFWNGQFDKDIVLGFYICMSSSLNENRRDLVNYCLKNEYTHILWIDDDMVFPKDVVSRLLIHDKDIVACNCTTRKQPLHTTASTDYIRVQSLGKTGLEEVHQVGFGVMLCKVDIFKKLPEPWFATPFDPKAERSDKAYVGEDIFFCKLAAHHGYKIYIDHDLSQQIGHVGEFVYGHQSLETK